MHAQFLTLGAEINILRSVKSSLPCVRSGVASFMRSADLLARPNFHPTSETAQLRGSTFNPGRTFGNYLARLKKGCALLNSDTYGLAPVVRGVAKGLKNAHGMSSEFPNFIESTLLLGMLKFAKPDSATGQAYFMSFFFVKGTLGGPSFGTSICG